MKRVKPKSCKFILIVFVLITSQYLSGSGEELVDVNMRIGKFTVQEWKNKIDSAWGEGFPKNEKIEIWNNYWETVDDEFACFNNLGNPSFWDSVYTKYNQEIAGGVSRGRFCAILQSASRRLQDGHTYIIDRKISKTKIRPGIPILKSGFVGFMNHFQAGLTPLPDSTLLVYTAIDDHPLNLEPGDIVLGYDRSLWKDIYPKLLEIEFPVKGLSGGSHNLSSTHNWLASCGNNWHLFDTVDVIKANTGDTVHLSTELLNDKPELFIVSEQLDIQGVLKPDVSNNKNVSWGLIEDSTIGYIYAWGWVRNAEQEWYDAIDTLMSYNKVKGIIVDFRYNFGGNMYLANKGLGLLFNNDIQVVGFSERCSEAERLELCELFTSSPFSYFELKSDESTYFNKPIAVLVGPATFSSGEQVSLLISKHSNTKFFGKPTNGTFNSPEKKSIHPDYVFQIGNTEAYYYERKNFYLTHAIFPNHSDFPDVKFENVWLTKESVIQGRDNVVESAIDWITNHMD